MTELPRQLAAALRSHLQRCPKTAAGESDADRHLQQSNRVTKSLNVSPAYASHLHSGIRELVQNWYDQCKASAGSNASLAVQDLTPAAAARAGGLLLVATAGRRSCGYLALSSVRKSASTCDVQLCNYGSTVSLAAMTLGESSKREQGIQFAGHFGEGAKVEINRITSSGASVTYFTSNQEWSFRYEQELGVQVLHLHSRRVSAQPSGDTLVVVRGVQRAWFQRENYLFLLTKPYGRFGGTTNQSQVELLPEVEHAGRLYVHGFFVSQADNLPLHGLNYCGSLTSLLGVGFGRDRNMVSASALAMHVPQLFVELSGDEARQRELARLLYTVLDQHPHSAWGSVYWAFRHYEADRLMADHMYQVFWEAHSRSCIPAAGADLIAEVEYLGVKSVRVSDKLFKVLERSQHHPSLDQLWERQYQRLLAIPDHVWREDDEADRYRATLIHTLLATFPKHLTPANLRIKALPAGNRSIIVAVQRSPQVGRKRGAGEVKEAVYIVDVTALSQEGVHRRLKESDPLFECDYKHCACLPIALEDAAIAAIAKVHRIDERRLRGELRRAQHRHHGLGWRGEMPAGQQPPDAAPFGGDPQPTAGSSEQDAGEASQPEEQQGPPKAPVPGASGPAAGSGSQPAGNPSCGQHCFPGCGGAKGTKLEPPEDLNAELLDAAKMEAAVYGSLNPSVGQQGRRVRLDFLRTSGATLPTARPPPAGDCRDSRGALVQSSIAVGDGAFLFLPQGVAAESLSAQQVQRCCSLYELLNSMHSTVFLEGQCGTSAFYLYYDPTDLFMAFNLGRAGEAGECFFNAAYDPHGAQPLARAKQWFLTTCHELAHNFVRAHNSAFADVMGQIALRYAPRFLSMHDPAA